MNRTKPGEQLTCPMCRRRFTVKNVGQTCCTRECGASYKRRNKGLDRPFTKDTSYFVVLWHKQGDSFEHIARALGRSVENVKLAYEEGIRCRR